MGKRYTIIIPNRNNRLLLKRLLKSIPIRDDIEIIIVDDCSDDQLLLNIDYPEFERVGYIVLYLKKHVGAGGARNCGLKYASGQWLLFADSDDFYMDGAFDVLDNYVSTQADIVFFNVCSVDTETLQKSNRDKKYGYYIKLYLSGKDPQAEYIRFKKWEPWYKMFNRNFIKLNNIRFEEIQRCNDMSFNLQASYLAKTFFATDKILYCVTTNPNSITKHKIEKDVFWDCILCEIKKNYLYRIINHRSWQSRYMFIIFCLLKNNGVKETILYLKMLYNRRNDIKKYRENLKYFLHD